MFLPSSTCVKDEKLKDNSPMKRDLSTENPSTKSHHYASSITNTIQIREIFSEIRSTITSDIDVLVITSAAYAASAANSLHLPSQVHAVSSETNFLDNCNLVRDFFVNAPEPDKDKVIPDISTAAAHALMP
ncbi:hypothetical protein HO133_002417 [Letharia lupina]|uniref:Uncharacterized protein n=1 Tax=Letharia lupina TaxID=560253 RepID=A0A8H6CE66_9LECA|nr:uncharacterized protein HO133_002417 [Letharia lupina]KAF6221561.1 hypothetical protein HO133_002417 [Letharia lupina]